MLWLCYELPSGLFGNTRDTSGMHEKAKFVSFNFMQPQKSEIQICSNKHETCLVCMHIFFNCVNMFLNFLVLLPLQICDKYALYFGNSAEFIYIND